MRLPILSILSILSALTSSAIDPRLMAAMYGDARSLSSQGIYRFGLTAIVRSTDAYEIETFDWRVIPAYLSDAELCDRIHSNGAAEITARPIPQWR